MVLVDDKCEPGIEGDPRPWLERDLSINQSNDPELCYPMFYIDPVDRCTVGENLKNGTYSLENPWSILFGANKSVSYVLSSVTQDVSDARYERTHFLDSAALLLIMALMFLTVITIWGFKVRRSRVLHETGLALIYGIVVGAALKYFAKSSVVNRFYLALEKNITNLTNCSNSELTFEVGDTIQINTIEDSFTCSIGGKVFKDAEGNFIRSSLLFDPEIFFFVLLPPIIFYAGYSLNKRYFFRNLGSLLLFAFVGTTVSSFIIGGLMYGYSLSGAESQGSLFANLTTFHVPEQFSKSIIPSLLFGALISATDPVTVLAIFHDLHVDFDIFSLVFGESVMNDAVAIVLFRSIDEYAVGTGHKFHWSALLRSVGSFVGIFFGSFVLGCAMGLVTALLMKFSKLRDYPLLETSMFVIMSYSTFVVAEFAQLTGIVAVLFCGIMQSYYTYINLSLESRRRTKEVFELINFLAENFVFSYIGLSLFTYNNHQWVPGFILFSFVAIFAGRLVNIYILSFILNLGRSKKISFRFQHMLMFAGLRGAIAFALAIRNTQNEERQLIFTTTLCIVMITLLFCGGLTTLVLQCLKIQVGLENEDGSICEDGLIIPHDKKKGNWLISKWSVLDQNYLIPIFTHHGRRVTEMCGYCPHWCIPFCNKCKPEEHRIMEEGSSGDGSTSDLESELEQNGEEDQILSFRKMDLSDDEDDDDRLEAEEGDLGLGSDVEGKRGYMQLSESTF